MGRTTEYENFGKKVKRQGGDVYAGGLFGPRKVGTWENTEALPESMQVETPRREDLDVSHQGLLKHYKTEYGLPRKYFNRELGSHLSRHQNLWDKGLCPSCESQLATTVCEPFAKRVARIASDHMELCCAKCGAWIEKRQRATIVPEMEAQVEVNEVITPPEPYDGYVNKPCGCTFEFDEDMHFYQAQVPENTEHSLVRLSKVTDTIKCDYCQNENELRGRKYKVERCEYCGRPFTEVKKLEGNGRGCIFTMVVEPHDNEERIRQNAEDHVRSCDECSFIEETDVEPERI